MAASKTTELYLKIKQNGMKFSPIDPVTNRVNKKIVVILFPEKATKVDTSVANVLLEQNPHLISTEPYQESEDIQVKTRKESEAHRAEIEKKRMMETTEERRKANARFVRVAQGTMARQKMKTAPSVDKGLMYSGDRNAIDDKGKPRFKDDPMQYVEILAEFAEVNRETVKREELRNFAKNLNVKLGKKSSVSAILPVLDERAEKLTKQIKAIMDRTKKADVATARKVEEAEANLLRPSKSSGLLPNVGPDSETEEAMKQEAETVQAVTEEVEAETQGEKTKK